MNHRRVIAIEPAADMAEAPSRGNVVPILHEIRHALARLIDTGVPTTIDLRAIPMGPGDEAALDEALGTGEVEVTLRALGTSTVLETAHAGVWVVTHRDEGGQTVARLIEISYVPEIVHSHAEDVAVGLRTLSEHLGIATQPRAPRRAHRPMPASGPAGSIHQKG